MNVSLNLKLFLKLIDKKKLLIPIPLTIAKIMAMFFQLLPKPLLTLDQLKLLKYDSILSGNYKSNLDIGYNCKLKFEKEVEKYCYMWKEAGQYSKRDLNSN